MQEKIVVMGIFIICAQAVIHFSPSNAYAKYLKLLLSMMVLIQLLQPILVVTLGKSESLQDFAYEMWEQLDSTWGREWKTVGGYEEQIDAIWEREVEEHAREYLVEAEGEVASETCETTQEQEGSNAEEVETVMIRIESMEKIRIGE